MKTYTAPPQSQQVKSAQKAARGLGWFSIALGVTELLAPVAVSRACGINVHPGVIRCYGLREIITGIGILRSANAKPWLWARVGGDLLDMSTLARDDGARSSGAAQLALLNVAAITALDAHTAYAYQPVPPGRYVDYSDRTGYRQPVEAVRGVVSTGASQ
jgi:hypothetical protein